MASTQYVVAVIISRQPVPLQQWQGGLTRTITSTLMQTLSATDLPKVRFLDLDSTQKFDENADARVLEITLPLPSNAPHLTTAQCTALTLDPTILTLRQTHNLNIAIQPSSLYHAHRAPGLIVFDMDSTLIQQEVIDELARTIGLYEKVAAITEAAMRGEAPYTDFSASLRARVALLKGVETSIWQRLREEIIRFTPGARELVRVLKMMGWKTAVLSGGFTPLALWVKEELGLDYAEANFLVESDGVLTGELVEGKAIVDATRKRVLLQALAEKEGVPLERTMAVGDGSNDLLMMHASGLGVAFNAKPKVQAQAPATLNADGLLDVLYYMGYTKMEVEALLAKEMRWERGQYLLRKPVGAATTIL